MPFQKGHPKIPHSGRKKGTKNKKTVILSAFVESIVNSQDIREKFLTELLSLKGTSYVTAILSLLEFCLPKLARREVSIAEDSVKYQVTLDFKSNSETNSIE